MEVKPMNRQLLRQQNNLVISGIGVIMLGIWTVVRMVLYSLLHMEEFTALMPETVPRILFIAITYVVIAVILAVILLVRFYIGRSAMAEGRGERRNSFSRGDRGQTPVSRKNVSGGKRRCKVL